MTTWAGNLSRWEELVKRLCHKGSILLIQVNSVLMSYRGEHWGVPNSYPIPQYRTKNWQIQKCRVENGRNTDTAFMIGDAYLTLYPSREFFLFFYLRHVYTRNQPQPSRENVRRSRTDGYNDRKARSLDVLPYHRVTIRNCVFIYS